MGNFFIWHELMDWFRVAKLQVECFNRECNCVDMFSRT